MGITEKFQKFCKNLEFSREEVDKIQVRLESICTRLNKDFRNMDITFGGSFVGSYGRQTANSWESDIDMLFLLPSQVYNQYSAYANNGPSALLQAVRSSIILGKG